MALFRALVTSLVILLPVAITSAEWICVNHDRQNCIFVPHGDWTRLESLREAERGDREAKQLLGARYDIVMFVLANIFPNNWDSFTP